MGILYGERFVTYRFWDLRQLHGRKMAVEISWGEYFGFGHADISRKENKGLTDHFKSLYLL